LLILILKFNFIIYYDYYYFYHGDYLVLFNHFLNRFGVIKNSS
jgi:hypothetical protein